MPDRRRRDSASGNCQEKSLDIYELFGIEKFWIVAF